MTTLLIYYAHKVIMLSSLVLVLAPATAASADCNSHAGAEHPNKSEEALKFKLAAIASILVAGALGVSLPLVGRKFSVLRPENDIFFMIKAFAAGVILATGFIHILPDAFRTLTSPCLSRNPWGKFPFSGFIAMAASIGTMMVDTLATSFYKGLHSNEAKQVNADEEIGDPEQAHGHAHAIPISYHGTKLSDLVRQRIISQVLELGIVVHSIIIGISLGASQSPDTIKPLLFALSFHQFFEGMGLGGCISQAKFKSLTTKIMSVFFSLTTPVGIGVGIGISSVYKQNRSSGLIVEGVFNSASAGILIYMALVDLLAADFTNPRMETNVRLQLGAHVSLLLGAGSMSLLAKWA